MKYENRKMKNLLRKNEKKSGKWKMNMEKNENEKDKIVVQKSNIYLGKKKEI